MTTVEANKRLNKMLHADWPVEDSAEIAAAYNRVVESILSSHIEKLTQKDKEIRVYAQEGMKILDHGHINLVSHMGNELSIVNAARVSYGGAASELTEKDIKLLKYLWANKHTSPFEHVSFTFDVKAPIFVFRQWHRHRTWSFNEISARYTELPEEFYVPEPFQITEQSKKNKQQRTDQELPNSVNAMQDIRLACRQSFQAYAELLQSGVPRELARIVLPVSTYSQMFATVNLLNLLKFLGLRDHDHAQYEIRVYAQGIKELIRPLFPNVLEIFEKCSS